VPRAARFHIAAFADLLKQLRFAPPESRQRQMEAAEALVGEIDAERNYPEEFIVYRITGFRPEGAEAPATFVGAALRGDLVNFVLQLSAGLALPARTALRNAISIEEAARRLNVSTKSVQRYRRQGLVCHFVTTEDGARRLACYEDSLARFQRREPALVAGAAGFSRVDQATGQAMYDEARAMRQAASLSLNEAALRLARKHGRARETVRSIVKRVDRRSAEPVFDRSPPLTRADARRIDRAVRLGIDLSRLAQRFGRSRAAIRLALDRERAEVLRGLGLRVIHLPTFDRPEARRVILGAPALSRGLVADSLPTDAAALVAALAAAPAFDTHAAVARLAGYNFLKHEAENQLAALPAWPGAPALDRLETDLRWAALVKRTLVTMLLPIGQVRIDITLERPLLAESAERVARLLRLAVDTASRQVESTDPGAKQRLDRAFSLAMDRALAAANLDASGRRAAARHAPGALMVSGLLDDLCPWQGRLLLSERHHGRIEELEGDARTAMELRYGLSGQPPRTVAEIAAAWNRPPQGVARLLNAAEARVRALRRDVRG
jgi:hypothetical protein